MKVLKKVLCIVLCIVGILNVLWWVGSWAEVVCKNGHPNPQYSPTNAFVVCFSDATPTE